MVSLLWCTHKPSIVEPVRIGERSKQVNLERRPTWELKVMVKALSLHSWHNTEEEKKRLLEAKKILKLRSKEGVSK